MLFHPFEAFFFVLFSILNIFVFSPRFYFSRFPHFPPSQLFPLLPLFSHYFRFFLLFLILGGQGRAPTRVAMAPEALPEGGEVGLVLVSPRTFREFSFRASGRGEVRAAAIERNAFHQYNGCLGRIKTVLGRLYSGTGLHAAWLDDWVMDSLQLGCARCPR